MFCKRDLLFEGAYSLLRWFRHLKISLDNFWGFLRQTNMIWRSLLLVEVISSSKDIIWRWLRVVGSLKLHVSFVKEPYKRNYILQERPMILRSLLLVEVISSSKYIIWRWLRVVGSLKLYVSFVKEPYKRNYILQERPMIWRSLLIVEVISSSKDIRLFVCRRWHASSSLL